MAAKCGGDLHKLPRALLTDFEREMARTSYRACALRSLKRKQGEAFDKEGELIFCEWHFANLQAIAKSEGYFVRRGSKKEEREARKAREEAILSAQPPPVDGFDAWLSADDTHQCSKSS